MRLQGGRERIKSCWDGYLGVWRKDGSKAEADRRYHDVVKSAGDGVVEGLLLGPPPSLSLDVQCLSRVFSKRGERRGGLDAQRLLCTLRHRRPIAYTLDPQDEIFGLC